MSSLALDVPARVMRPIDIFSYASYAFLKLNAQLVSYSLSLLSSLSQTNLFRLTGVNFTQEQIAELSKNDGEVSGPIEFCPT